MNVIEVKFSTFKGAFKFAARQQRGRSAAKQE